MHHLLTILKIFIFLKLVILMVAAIVLFQPFTRNWRGHC